MRAADTPTHCSSRGDGVVTELKSSGGLLGLFKGEEYPTRNTQLHPGDKVLLYTDGVELAFQKNPETDLQTTAYLQAFTSLANLPVHDMFRAIHEQLDNEAGSLSPKDDVTLVGLEVLP